MKKGFTLIELIVVITILAILGTIAFISFKGFSSEARNSTRISDSTNIKKALSAMFIVDGVYPMPDSSFRTLDRNSNVYSVQGKMGKIAQDRIGINGAKDPSSKTFYDYSTNETYKDYSLGIIFEGNFSYSFENAKAEDGTTTLKEYGTGVGFLVEKGTNNIVESNTDIVLNTSDSTYDLVVKDQVFSPEEISYASMKSCKEIKAENSSAKTGKYMVTPKDKTFQVHCEMDYEGGGWTYWNGGKVDENTRDEEFALYGYNETVPNKFNELYRLKKDFLKDIDFTESVTFMNGETSDYSARFKYPTTMNAVLDSYYDLWPYLEGKTFKGYFTHVFKEDFVSSRYNDGTPKVTRTKGTTIPHSESGVNCYSTSSKYPGHFKCGTNAAETSQNPWYQSWRITNGREIYADNFTSNPGRWKTERQSSPVVNDGLFDKDKLGYGVHTCTRISDENGSPITAPCSELPFTQGLFNKNGCYNSNAAWMNFITGNQCDYRQDTSVWYEWRDYVR